jgi:hypothetical protein
MGGVVARHSTHGRDARATCGMTVSVMGGVVARHSTHGRDARATAHGLEARATTMR